MVRIGFGKPAVACDGYMLTPGISGVARKLASPHNRPDRMIWFGVRDGCVDARYAEGYLTDRPGFGLPRVMRQVKKASVNNQAASFFRNSIGESWPNLFLNHSVLKKLCALLSEQ